MEGKKKDNEEEDREGPKRLKEKGRRRGRREDEKKLGDSSTAFACGKSVGTVRCKVNGPGFGLLARSPRSAEVNDGTVLLSGFPYAPARVKSGETRTTGRCTTIHDRRRRREAIDL